jgi:tetratricopeptide (TPR) repeat protein
MVTTSWDETRGKIKHAYDKIESAYQKHVLYAVDIVKERPLLNTAVKMALPAIPIIGPSLKELYDNIGGAGTKSEEEKAKQILEFLGKLEQQNKEQFERIAEDFKTNREAIINVIHQNRIALTDLISRSSAELLEAVTELKEDTSEIRTKVGKIEKILERRQIPIQPKHPPIPSVFRGESTKIFVGRKQDINTIKNYFAESNLPISITGEGGIGKSELAYKAMHKSEDMFDLIIPIYFGSLLTFNSFLLEMARSLNLPIDEFEKGLSLENRREIIINTLGQQFKHPLIYADNYETVAGVLSTNDSSASASIQIEQDNARKINGFLENLPPNTAILLTSRERHNLDVERPVRLDGLSEAEGRDLFIELAINHFPIGGPSEKIRKALEELSKKAGGHPLSIELLARSYRGQGLSKLKGMLQHMGIGVINPKEETERLQSLRSCFEYSFDTLSHTQKDLLPKLTLFNSPFLEDAVKKIFDFKGSSEMLLDLYDHSLLRRIDFNEDARHDSDSNDKNYYLYYFHPAIRNYLERKVTEGANSKELQEEYGNQFSLYYYKLIEEIYQAVGTEEHVFSFEHFNLIWQGKDNDFERAVGLAKDRLLASFISSYLGLILHTLGMYSAALENHNKALAIHKELQDRVGMAADYKNMGNVFYSQDDSDQALQYHTKALAIDEQLQDRVVKATFTKHYNTIRKH